MQRAVHLESWVCAVVILVGATLPAVAAPELPEAYGKLPLTFEANRGQVDEPVRFLSRGLGYTLFLTPTEAVLSLRGATAVRMRPVGGNPDPRMTGASPQATTSNYLVGNDPRQWRAGVPHFARVRVEDVYPGIDLLYRGNQRQLEYDFVIAPGADPARIRLAFQGVDALELGAKGELILRTPNGDLVQHAPLIYQLLGQRRQRVEGRFVLGTRHEVGFEVGRYDRTRPLIIDPVISYSTFLGSGGADLATDIAIDAAGSAYVTGLTYSVIFPGIDSSSIQPTNNGNSDGFVTKINPAGTAIVYSTFLGGRRDDIPTGIAVDGAGNAYVTGLTDSPDFIGVGGSPIQPAYGGGSNDAFVMKINADGTGLVYSTYLGGSLGDLATGIGVDGAGNAYVTGTTGSANFPGISASSIQPAFGGGFKDAFVTKIDPAGTAILYSTFLGGNREDEGIDIAVDGAGNAHVTGYTGSASFPGVGVGSMQPFLNGFADAFVTKIDPGGTAIVYSTFLGGSSFDNGADITVDGMGNTYVTGHTYSPDFPVVGGIQPVFRGATDAFVTKIDATGTAIVYSTYLGGSSYDLGFSIAVDTKGSAYVTGRTDSADFTGVTGGSIQPTYKGYNDGFVTKIDTTGTTIVYSTYLGGNAGDQGAGIVVDEVGNAYVAGDTASPTFPGVSGSSIQPAPGGGGTNDAFVTKISSAELNIEEIPTLSQWGWITMALLLATMGLLGTRRIWPQT